MLNIWASMKGTGYGFREICVTEEVIKGKVDLQPKLFNSRHKRIRSGLGKRGGLKNRTNQRFKCA